MIHTWQQIFPKYMGLGLTFGRFGIKNAAFTFSSTLEILKLRKKRGYF